jgi:hypothetical protein
MIHHTQPDHVSSLGFFDLKHLISLPLSWLLLLSLSWSGSAGVPQGSISCDFQSYPYSGASIFMALSHTSAHSLLKGPTGFQMCLSTWHVQH